MHANSVLFSPLAVARAKLVTLGAPGALLRRILNSARSLKDPDHVSIARLVSDEIARKTPSGIVCEKSIRAGVPIPDEIVLSFTRRWFWSRKTSRGFIAEGFPATMNQAIVFDEWLDGRDESLTACIKVEQSEEDLILEAENTWVCPTDGSRYVNGLDVQIVPGHCNLCRTLLAPAGHDAVREVQMWFRNHVTSVRAVADFYESRGLLLRVKSQDAADGAIDRLFARISELVVDR